MKNMILKKGIKYLALFFLVTLIFVYIDEHIPFTARYPIYGTNKTKTYTFKKLWSRSVLWDWNEWTGYH